MSDYSNLLVYLDGEFVAWNDARIHVFTPAVKYGAAVFEGIRGYWNADTEKMYLFRLEEHMRRLELSQRIMRFGRIVPAETMMEATVDLIRRNAFRAAVHIRPTVYVAGAGESNAQTPIGTFITAIARDTPKKVERGVRAQISSWQRISDNVMPARAKANGNYNNSRYAGLQAAKDGYDAAIFLNSRGKLSEGQAMCLFLVRNGVAVTPSATSDILESITRDTVIRLLREKGIEVQERDVDRSEFFDASEAFFCGTGAEITPIIDVDGDAIGAGTPGELTRALQATYFDLAFGRTNPDHAWLTAV
ncbi:MULTISPECIES: branched-chain amino acid transaminase [unclassified Shinella]|uniref:branched-chain amino acid transaminase n=1 Tax=unclassified Shinella TaxID=2643062 RepID=UPI00225D2266|nr:MULTISPECIES: branched-chain amino acid transaminase [unclassified Shinella]MCO5137736.1 branched-chain amino acid transaminase [Shinella sp.]MDC7257854.1 branched-chain amino acid transaminase [Shinella sp. YE25]CAI0335399.1 Branched-chain-amino-acid aminotransferase [Rhizobiaceae bacterium]CAK7259705.1 Branched-chain-amino-acid aminotransferase [Shinella sp. WSC3-e]